MENITSLEQQSFKNETTSLKWELLSIRGKINEELNTVLEKYSEGIFFNNFLEIHAQPWYSMWRQDRRQPVSKTGNDCSAGHVLNKCGSSTFTGIQTSAVCSTCGFSFILESQVENLLTVFHINIPVIWSQTKYKTHTPNIYLLQKNSIFIFIYVALLNYL